MRLCQPYNAAMHRTMTRRQVRDFDAEAIHTLGVPGAVLMENAGRGSAEVVAEMMDTAGTKRVVLFCGCGNNGGDGFVIARHLHNLGFEPLTVLCGLEQKLTPDARTHYEILGRMKLPVIHLDLSQSAILHQIRMAAAGCSLVVDALFGTGLKEELSNPYIQVITAINALHIPILSVDIPSGLDCDAGIPLPVCIKAAATVSFVAAKQGFFAHPNAMETVGSLYIASIGVNPPSDESA